MTDHLMPRDRSCHATSARAGGRDSFRTSPHGRAWSHLFFRCAVLDSTLWGLHCTRVKQAGGAVSESPAHRLRMLRYWVHSLGLRLGNVVRRLSLCTSSQLFGLNLKRPVFHLSHCRLLVTSVGGRRFENLCIEHKYRRLTPKKFDFGTLWTS